MKILSKVIQSITQFTSWIALATMALMMVFITFGVTSRALNHPILGDVEIVQLGMVVLIMLGLAYTQSQNAHISIGLVVDRFPKRIQALLDVLAYVLTFSVSFLIAWIFIEEGLDNIYKSR